MDNDEMLIVIKDLFEKKVEEMKTYTGVLVERLESNVKTVAEGHEILNKKLDEVNNKVDRLNDRVDRLNDRVDNLNKRVDVIEKDIGIVKNYVIGVDEKLNEHEVILKRAK